jgi:hypothetical protein
LSTYPWPVSITFTDGTCSMYHLENTQRFEDGACTYEATGDRVNLHWQGIHLALNHTADPYGTRST